MDNIFAFTKATSVEELKFDGDKFLYKTISSGNNQAVVDLRAEVEDYEKRREPPLWFKILQGVLLILAFASMIFLVLCGKTINELIQTDIVIVIVAIASLIGAIVVLTINRIRDKRYAKSDEFKALISKSEDIVLAIKTDLGIPTGVREYDVLAKPYKVENGIKVNSERFDYLPLSNYVYTIVDKGDKKGDGIKLCIGDLERVYAIDKQDIVKITYVEGPVTLSRWTKDVPVKDKSWAEYGVKKLSGDMVSVCGYYDFEIKSEYGDFTLAVAPYDAKAIAHMIGKKCPPIKNK